MIRQFKILFLIMLLAITLSGCTLSFGTSSGTSSGNVADGGVYKSLNKGASWTQKTSIQGVNTKRSFSGIDIISLAIDPSDNKAIYAGSFENGLFYSYDSGESWQVATGLGKVSISNIAVDPADKCVIYATAGNKVLKSEDCSRTWAQVYFDNDLKASVSSLVIDYANSNNIFIGTSNGDIIKSSDKGASWRALDRFDSQVDKIAISPANPKIMFVGTTARGIFRSVDGGDKWEKLADKLKDFDGSNRFRDLAIVKSDKAVIFLATNYGLLKSVDDGNTWTKIELLTAEAEAKIYSIAVNSGDANEINYTTGTTFYHSLDGGKNWSAKKLPTGRAGYKLLLDPKNSAILYLAAKSK
ncbi:MAG: YCF48-related protein [Patescibacteria group bacterium]|nr:YCF48-related protein [Patescibacteria group bacterium]